jgi:hypothetical protein
MKKIICNGRRLREMNTDKRSGKGWLVLTTILLMITLAFMGCIEDGGDDDDNGNGNGGGNIVTMNSLELRYDWDPYQRGFDSLNKGNVLHLEDTVKDIRAEGADTYINLGAITVKVMGPEIRDTVSKYEKIRITLVVTDVQVKYGEATSDDFIGHMEEPYTTYTFEWFQEDLNGFGGGLVINPDAVTEI